MQTSRKQPSITTFTNNVSLVVHVCVCLGGAVATQIGKLELLQAKAGGLFSNKTWLTGPISV